MERRDVTFDLAAVQQALAGDRLDGWLLYDFHGSNPIAQAVTGLTGRHTTRRWYYFVPAAGQPRKLVHAIESGVLEHVPGETRTYAGREALAAELPQLVAGARRVAMEYSPGCAIPYISRVDAGTIEWLRGLGLTIVSSGDLVGRFEAAWGEAEIRSHRTASERLYRIKDQAFSLIGDCLRRGQPITELHVQAAMMEWFASEGLVTDAPPIVAVGPHSGDPHYGPTRETSAPITRDAVVLLDLWGKLDEPGAVFADITWTGVTGQVPTVVSEVFTVVIAARDAALEAVQGALAEGRDFRGWEVDRAAREVIRRAGYADRFVHRTGHSLGTSVHGNGVHMDDYETHDDRRLLPGTGFTIEPGVYLQDFGIRSEINVIVGKGVAEVTGPLQQAFVQVV
jgi:Xaa-Pro aminopeptidase